MAREEAVAEEIADEITAQADSDPNPRYWEDRFDRCPAAAAANTPINPLKPPPLTQLQFSAR
jgi:hypothetical protein